jgi:hypothetical protein
MSYTNGLDDPSAHFQTALYTGTGSTQSITNDGNSDMQPDWVWVKNRSDTGHNVVFDSSRGVNNRLITNLTIAEDTGAGYGTVSAFNSDGFSVTNGLNTGNNTLTYAAWQWKANGGTTSSNTDGSKTATVQANTDAGFSIVTYAGSGSASTVGHGLATTPDVIIFKNRSAANVWAVYHQSLGNNLKLELNSTNAQDSDGSFMNGTLPTSSVFTVGASVNTNGSGSNYVAYCFAEKQGYSKFGSYVGNGTSGTDGTFIYTGFKPAFVMTKRANSVDAWVIYDNKRDSHNVMNNYLLPNSNAAEGTFANWDFVSNGFKSRTGNSQGASGVTFIYMAFAESSFVTSSGIPTTAR